MSIVVVAREEPITASWLIGGVGNQSQPGGLLGWKTNQDLFVRDCIVCWGLHVLGCNIMQQNCVAFIDNDMRVYMSSYVFMHFYRQAQYNCN